MIVTTIFCENRRAPSSLSFNRTRDYCSRQIFQQMNESLPKRKASQFDNNRKNIHKQPLHATIAPWTVTFISSLIWGYVFCVSEQQSIWLLRSTEFALNVVRVYESVVFSLAKCLIWCQCRREMWPENWLISRWLHSERPNSKYAWNGSVQSDQQHGAQNEAEISVPSLNRIHRICW